MKMKPALPAALLAAAPSSVPMQASAVDSGPSPPVSGNHADGRKAIEAKNWNRAIKSFIAAAQRDSRNADTQNLLGYAYRNAGQLDPRLRGSHEYVGEAYLMVNNLAKAEERLPALISICPRVCEEREDSARSVERYKAGRK